MTHRERMLAALAGRPADRISWTPRLDLWYRANRRAGTLPAEYRKASLTEIVDDLGWGFHAVIPDFRDLAGGGDDSDRALGIYNLRVLPFRTVIENVEKSVTIQGERTIVEYRTPKGRVRTATLYTRAMEQAGISITHVDEHAFKSAADYPALGWLFENARVEENSAGYREFAASVGERGLAVARYNLAASPLHLIQCELMPVDLFFYEVHDHPDELAGLAGKVGLYYDRMLRSAAESAAEVILLGGNFDAMIQYPPFFEEHILPTLRRFADALHARGKFLMCHTDGENSGLLEHYLAAGLDVADSVCPAPMTRLSFKEVRDFFAGRITIMGGVPSVALLPQSMSGRDFSAYLDEFFEAVGAGDHLILGVSDTTPPAAGFERLREVARRVEEFGPVGEGAS